MRWGSMGWAIGRDREGASAVLVQCHGRKGLGDCPLIWSDVAVAPGPRGTLGLSSGGALVSGVGIGVVNAMGIVWAGRLGMIVKALLRSWRSVMVASG